MDGWKEGRGVIRLGGKKCFLSSSPRYEVILCICGYMCESFLFFPLCEWNRLLTRRWGWRRMKRGRTFFCIFHMRAKRKIKRNAPFFLTSRFADSMGREGRYKNGFCLYIKTGVVLPLGGMIIFPFFFPFVCLLFLSWETPPPPPLTYCVL
ncbi:hypothetical protein F4809DRAFT_452393 [Biscogniauxia mediterranea]|nr:hypothetical protein F4809DRAFT_452393 [Biscogniauxia mediterranea]